MTAKNDETPELERIRRFLAERRFAVVGASDDFSKYGAKVLAAYLQKGLDATPVNPRGGEIQGRKACARLQDIPGGVDAVSVVTPPAVTEQVVKDAAAAGARHIWMQPGAESELAITRAQELGLSVLAEGPCVLVVLGYRERRPDAG
jgi:predicted CoA-binding protein